MGAGIMSADGPVPALADYLSVPDQKRTDRHLTGLLCNFRECNRALHKQKIMFGARFDTGQHPRSRLCVNKSKKNPNRFCFLVTTT